MPRPKRKHDSVSVTASEGSSSPPPQPRITRQAKKLLDAAASASTGTQRPAQPKANIRKDRGIVGRPPVPQTRTSAKSAKTTRARPTVSTDDDDGTPEVGDPAILPRTKGPTRPVNSKPPKKGRFISSPENDDIVTDDAERTTLPTLLPKAKP